MFPSTSPVLTPAGRRIGLPSAEVQGRLAVVAYGDAQDEQRNNLRSHYSPGAVVPGAGVPVVIHVNPVHSIMKEIVGIQLWSVIDGVTRHQNEFRVDRKIDADAHAR